MTKLYVELYLGSKDGLKGLLESNLTNLASFYEDNLWYGLNPEILSYVKTLNFSGSLCPKSIIQARYIDQFIEYAFDFYGEHQNFAEILGEGWYSSDEVQNLISVSGRRLFSGFGTEFNPEKNSAKIGYYTFQELVALKVGDGTSFATKFDAVKNLAISKECGLVYTVE